MDTNAGKSDFPGMFAFLDVTTGRNLVGKSPWSIPAIVQGINCASRLLRTEFPSGSSDFEFQISGLHIAIGSKNWNYR